MTRADPPPSNGIECHRDHHPTATKGIH